jgi:sulfoxide reductase heme-binding subunit YedZ
MLAWTSARTFDDLMTLQMQPIFVEEKELPAKVRRRGRFLALQVIAHIAAWIPLAVLLADGLAGNLTENPIQYVTQRLGKDAILMLMVALAVTPLEILTGFRQLQRLSRPLGLYAFLYVCLHLLMFVGVDYGFDFSLLWQDAQGKTYLLFGLGGFLILLALAVTSFRWWMKRLGILWKRLHQLVYGAGILVVIHYALAVKGDLIHLQGDVAKPAIYALFVTGLLVLRLKPVRLAVIRLRRRAVQGYLERRNAV